MQGCSLGRAGATLRTKRVETSLDTPTKSRGDYRCGVLMRTCGRRKNPLIVQLCYPTLNATKIIQVEKKEKSNLTRYKENKKDEKKKKKDHKTLVCVRKSSNTHMQWVVGEKEN